MDTLYPHYVAQEMSNGQMVNATTSGTKNAINSIK